MVEKMLRLMLFIAILAASSFYVDAQVPDLDNRFLELSKKGKWLIEFYAPWCGHCKKLEPIFHGIHHSLRNTDVTVAKIDATRWSTVASQFDVRGFPTIKFFDGDNIYTFRGERTGEDIIEFVNKAKGPAVRRLSSVGKFNEARSHHTDGVFYMFVGDDDPNGDLYTKYSSVAGEQVSLAYFYAGSKTTLPQDIHIESFPTILVFKDRAVYEFKAPLRSSVMSSVQQWINGERYQAYPLVTGGNINEMADTGKFLVIFTIDLKNTERLTLNQRLKDIGQYMAKNEREKFHSHFQFLWMDDPDTTNNIMMAFITMPHVLILDPTLHLYYVPHTNMDDIDATILGQFLEDVKNGKIEASGGTGFFQRLKRLGYDILVTVISVWESSRWLFLIMFGLPTAVISIVCYSLCCMDTVDEELHSDEEDSDEEYREILKEQQLLKEKSIEESSVRQRQAHDKAE